MRGSEVRDPCMRQESVSATPSTTHTMVACRVHGCVAEVD
ncbi:hypothetical protein SAMN05444695_101453 [Rhodococcus triatomae]|uniref:Uncharacterized protein n=1 Tax=Rhodococcus triatomae TaxID=300028 RepID=A0A1G8AKC3_9NOCA|nr:hypothetical protein SAMN05444695_101453 [Rhodococcus triatomae]